LGIAGIASAGIGAAGSLGAGSEQAGAAKSAEQLQYQEQQQALQFQEQEWEQQQQNEAPYLQAGGKAIGNLYNLANGGLPAWSGSFQAPTAQQAEQTPGYQFQVQQGDQALQNSAAARGGVLSSGTAKNLEAYNQGLASTDYQQVFNNSLTQYQQAYNEYQQNQLNQFNRLASVAGVGQTAVGQTGQLGQAASNNLGNIFLTGGAQQGQDLQFGAAANASGYVGAANAAAGGLGSLSGALTLQQILAQNGQNPGQVPNYDPNYNYMTTTGPTQE